jgi:hypothetical protein
LLESVHSIIYAAPRCQIDELLVVKEQFLLRYSREWASPAIKGEGKVNVKVKSLLSSSPPPSEVVVQELEAIAKEAGVEFNAKEDLRKSVLGLDLVESKKVAAVAAAGPAAPLDPSTWNLVSPGSAPANAPGAKQPPQQQPHHHPGPGGPQSKQPGAQQQQGMPMAMSYLDPMAGTSMMLPLGYPFGSGYQYPYGINVMNQQTIRRDTTAEEGGMLLPSVGFGVPVNLPQFLDGNNSRPNSLQNSIQVQLPPASAARGGFQAPAEAMQPSSSATFAAPSTSAPPSSTNGSKEIPTKEIDDENPVEIPEFVPNNAPLPQQPQQTSNSLAARFAALKK